MDQKKLIKWFGLGFLVVAGVTALRAAPYAFDNPVTKMIETPTAKVITAPIEKPFAIFFSYPTFTTLEPNFEGTDIQKFYERAIQAYYPISTNASPSEKERQLVQASFGGFTKTEFETEEQFKTRIESAISSNSDLNNILNNHVIFTDDLGWETSYNPDKQHYEISLLLHKSIKTISVPQEDYIATNSFGVSTKVKKNFYIYYDLDFKNKTPSEIFLKMLPQAAQENKDNLTILYIFKPIYPYVSTSTWNKEATLNSPRETNTRTYSLVGNLEGYAVYNKKTGEVLIHKKLH